MKKIIFFLILIVVVFPNAFRFFKFFLVGLIFIFLYNKLNSVFFNKYRRFLFFGLLISVFYIAFGQLFSKQPYLSFIQSTAVYIIFPIFWILFSDYILTKFSPLYILKYLTMFGFLACCSVFLTLWLIDNNYKEYLLLIIEDPKKTISSDGVVELSLHVYGSLLFLIPAIVTSINQFSLIKKYILLSVLFFSVVYSGRSVLIISFLIGVIGYFITSRAKINSIIILLVTIGIASALISYFEIPIIAIWKLSLQKITEINEHDVRNIQFWEFLKGIQDYYYLFGHGHGVGIDFIRHEKYFWRGYELLPMATLYRVGVLGLISYSLPFIFSLRKYYSLFLRKKNTVIDDFFIFGIIGIVVGSLTNPYLESFDFQLLYFISFCYFINRKFHKMNKNIENT